jgi:hypothetical protein
MPCDGVSSSQLGLCLRSLYGRRSLWSPGLIPSLQIIISHAQEIVKGCKVPSACLLSTGTSFSAVLPACSVRTPIPNKIEHSLPLPSSDSMTISSLAGLGFGWEANSRSLAESLSVRAVSTGPKTLLLSFWLFAFFVLARAPFAILSYWKGQLEI